MSRSCLPLITLNFLCSSWKADVLLFKCWRACADFFFQGFHLVGFQSSKWLKANSILPLSRNVIGFRFFYPQLIHFSVHVIPSQKFIIFGDCTIHQTDQSYCWKTIKSVIQRSMKFLKISWQELHYFSSIAVIVLESKLDQKKDD